jgi:predicted nucleic acid-binding protein
MISLRGQPVLLIITDYVLDETLTLLLYHAGRDAALTFGEAVQRSRNTKLIYTDASAWNSAWQWFKKYTDKTGAFTDCVSLNRLASSFGLDDVI